MIAGGFATLEEYLQWMSTPLDPAILDALEDAQEAAYLEDELMEEIRREAKGEDPDKKIVEDEDNCELNFASGLWPQAGLTPTVILPPHQEEIKSQE
jgi:hypothetical protein